MDLKALFFASIALAFLLLSPAIAQKSPPAPVVPLPPAPAPAPGPHYANLTYLFQYAGPYHIFLDYLEQTKVIDTFQNQANNSYGTKPGPGITIFVPRDSAFTALEKADLANLTSDQIKTLLLYHAFPRYYSLADFKSVANPISTFAGGQYTLNITESNGVVHILSSWSRPKLISSVWSTDKVAVYEVDKLLLPNQIFSVDPPLAPAPAPAPETGKASDLAPSKGASSSSPKSSESPNSGSYRGSGINVLSFLALALSGALVLFL